MSQSDAPSGAPTRDVGSGGGEDRRYRIVSAAILGLAAGVAVVGSNRPPLLPATHSDGVEYTSAAESLVSRGTLEIPVTHWSDPDSTTVLSHYPPGFSVAIALPMRVARVSSATSVRWALGAGAALAAGMVFWIASGIGGLWAGLVASALVAATPALAGIYVAVWSESLYLGTALLLLWALVTKPRRTLLHGVLAALGVALRYVGVAGVATAVWLAWGGRTTRRDRVLDAARAGGPGLLFLLGWQVYVGGGSEEIRSAGVYPGAAAQAAEFVLLLGAWLSPVNLGRVIPPEWVILGVAIVGLTVIVGGRPADPAGDGSAWPLRSPSSPARIARARKVFSLFALIYVGVVVTSRVFLDPLVPFDARLFAPVLVLISIAFSVALARGLRRWPRPVGVALHGLVAIWMYFGVLDLRELVTVSSRDGRYYTHVRWSEDPIVRSVDRGWTSPYLYSNEAAMVYFYGSRPAKHLWRSHEDAAAFRAAFEARPGPILVTLPAKEVDVSLETIERTLDVWLYRRSEAAALYLPAGIAAPD